MAGKNPACESHTDRQIGIFLGSENNTRTRVAAGEVECSTGQQTGRIFTYCCSVVVFQHRRRLPCCLRIWEWAFLAHCSASRWIDTRALVALAINRVSMTPSDQWGLESWSMIRWTRACALISSKPAYQRHQVQWQEVLCICRCVYMYMHHHVASLTII